MYELGEASSWRFEAVSPGPSKFSAWSRSWELFDEPVPMIIEGTLINDRSRAWVGIAHNTGPMALGVILGWWIAGYGVGSIPGSGGPTTAVERHSAIPAPAQQVSRHRVRSTARSTATPRIGCLHRVVPGHRRSAEVQKLSD